MQNLQVHHIKFRSQSGSDVEQNLIRLRAKCHAYHPVPSDETLASMPEPNRHPAALSGHASLGDCFGAMYLDRHLDARAEPVDDRHRDDRP